MSLQIIVELIDLYLVRPRRRTIYLYDELIHDPYYHTIKNKGVHSTIKTHTHEHLNIGVTEKIPPNHSHINHPPEEEAQRPVSVTHLLGEAAPRLGEKPRLVGTQP